MEQVFVDELALYEREGLPVPDVRPPDNAAVCAIFDKPQFGAFPLLDSQSRAAKPSDEAFCREMHEQHAANPHFGAADSAFMAASKLTADEAFVVKHFAATVAYSVDGFLDKNDSKLSDTFEASLRTSTQPFIKEVIRAESGGMIAPAPTLPGTAGFSSVGKTFLNDLRKLMAELQATQPHFVRCIKPNEAMQPKLVEGPMVMVQMASSGLLEAVKLMQASYPSRSTYEELLRVFGNQLPKSTQGLPAAQQVEILLYGTTAEPHEYLLGRQLVFFTREAGRVLDELRSTPASMIRPRMVARLEAKPALSPDERALLEQLKQLIKQEILDRARRRKEAILIAVTVAVKMKRRARTHLAQMKRAATRIEARHRGNRDRRERDRRMHIRDVERRKKEEEQLAARLQAEKEAAATAAAAAAAAADAEAAERAAEEMLRIAEAEAAEAAALEQAAAGRRSGGGGGGGGGGRARGGGGGGRARGGAGGAGRARGGGEGEEVPQADRQLGTAEGPRGRGDGARDARARRPGGGGARKGGEEARRGDTSCELRCREPRHGRRQWHPLLPGHCVLGRDRHLPEAQL